MNPVSRLEQFEEICSIRHESIEKRLDAGSKRFVRMELLIMGLYATIIGTYVLEKVL
tara:strand:- start:1564 stop:1734 length:171 start_codon:yes stop_codon:yes gene_type:complete